MSFVKSTVIFTGIQIIMNSYGLVFLLLTFIFAGCKSEPDTFQFDKDPSLWDYTDYGLVHLGEERLPAVPQTQRDRVFKEKSVERIQTIGWYPEAEEAGPQDEMLFLVAAAHVDSSEEHIYIFDREDLRVKKFSLQTGRLVQVFGGVEGEGPGEFRFPSGFSVSPKGRVLVSDSRNRKVVAFAPDGTHEKDIALDFAGASVVVHGEDEFIVPLTGNFDELEFYGRFDASGNLQKQFGQLTSDVRLKGGLGGILVGQAEGLTVHVIGRTGYLLGFSDDQDFLYFRAGIDGPKPLPQWIRSEPKGTALASFTLDPKSLDPASYKTLNIWDDLVYVLRFDVNDSLDVKYPADAYNIYSGDYIYSIKNPDPENCTIRFVTVNYVFTSCQNEGVVQWKRVE